MKDYTFGEYIESGEAQRDWEEFLEGVKKLKPPLTPQKLNEVIWENELKKNKLAIAPINRIMGNLISYDPVFYQFTIPFRKQELQKLIQERYKDI